jgi:hypothetical protein
MGVARLNIWVSDVADPCGTFKGSGQMSILDCKGVLEWPCGRFADPEGQWRPVPNGQYHDLPFRCGHLEVEVPPGCYWAVAGYVGPPIGHGIHLNGTTHVGIAEVACGQTACVKLFNPTLRLCWDWFLVGLRAAAVGGHEPVIQEEQIREIEERGNEILKAVGAAPIEETVESVLADLTTKRE